MHLMSLYRNLMEKESLMFISALIYSGALIENSHRALVDHIKNDNLEGYLSLIGPHPVFLNKKVIIVN